MSAAGDIGPGSVFGPYVIAARIGSGGMGTVYRATDKRLHRDVAMKVIRADQCADPRRRRRFEIEARAAAKLAHANIVSIYDVGEEGGTPYLVSELVAGGTLADRLRRGRLTISQALTMAVPIAEALAEAHRQGVVHRDLKPENILLTADERSVLAAEILDGRSRRRDENPRVLAGDGVSLDPDHGLVIATEDVLALIQRNLA